MNFSSGSPPSLPSPWSHRSRRAEDMNNNLKAPPTTMPCFPCKKHLQEDFKKWGHPVQAAACYHTHSLISMGQLWTKRAANHFHRIYLSTNRDTLPLLWRLIQSLQIPPPAPPVHILRADTIGLFLKLPDHTFSWRLLEPPGSSRMQLTVVEVSKVGVLSLPVTHRHMHVHKAPLLFFSWMQILLRCASKENVQYTSSVSLK